MQELEITRATVEQAPEVLRVQRLAFAEEMKKYQAADIPPLRETVQQVEESISAGAVLVATVDGRVVGAVRLNRKGQSCLVGRLVVLPELWGQGTGTALLRAVEGCCSGAERLELFTGSNSRRSMELYERAGYREVRREPVEGGFELVYMEKPLC
jgi:N-acetylglutamate synthase-like GNAT family acetyltransferase